MSDLVAFRAARRARNTKRVPRWRGDVADIALGEGGYGKVYAVSDDVVVKVVAIDGDYTEDDMFTADITKNPFREVAIYQRSNRLVAKGLTDHVAMMLDARKVRKVRKLHLYLERFDSSMYDWIQSGKATDGALRSVVAQALHGYYVMERELGFHQSDFYNNNVLVKATASAPRTWRWTVDGLDRPDGPDGPDGLSGLVCSVPSFGVFACLSDFGACDIDAFPPIPLSAAHERRDAHQRAMQPVKFIEDMVPLALESGIKGPFIDTLEGILYDRVLYERQGTPSGSKLASFNAVEGRRILPDGRSRICAPPTAAELLRLCCDVHKGTGALKKRPERAHKETERVRSGERPERDRRTAGPWVTRCSGLQEAPLSKMDPRMTPTVLL
jgi:hypothetical protein